MTPRLLTCGEGETKEESMEKVKYVTLERVDLEPTRSSLVLTLEFQEV